MEKIRILSVLIILLFAFNGIALAGAPLKPAPLKKVAPVEEYIPPPSPKAPAPSVVKPLVISKYSTWGLGLGGNPIIGYVEKDQYGYPRTEYTGPFYGIDWVLGFGVTWYSGQPSVEDINAAVQKIKRSNPNVGDKELPSLVRKELGNSVTYVGLGTALLILPVNAEIGIQWIINDNTRTRLGIGLPTLLCFGINWDF